MPQHRRLDDGSDCIRLQPEPLHDLLSAPEQRVRFDAEATRCGLHDVTLGLSSSSETGGASTALLVDFPDAIDREAALLSQHTAGAKPLLLGE
jgi:hypothetical protein